MVYNRMVIEGEWRMPSLGTAWVDPAGPEVVRRWIESLTGCP